MKKLHWGAVALLLLTSFSLSAQSSAVRLEVNTAKSQATVNPDMYGIFFEDINFGADGGLYAELVKNRSFEFPQALMGWNTFGNVEVRTDNAPFERNPHYVRLSSSGHAHKHTGIENEGFRGMGIKNDAEYRFSVWGRKADRKNNAKIRVELVDSNNRPFVHQEIAINSDQWNNYEVVLKSGRTDAHAFLRIFLVGDASVDLEHISLFPVDTWKGHKNGLRKDLAQALYDLHPGVFRFPGGCIVEGTDLETRYDWKKSVGPVENRPTNENRWHYTFTDHFFPDYFQSYGMGFYELFLLAEEIGAAPLPVVNCGLACQYQNDCAEAHVPVDKLDDYIQDALDLIEFANGDPSTEWGKVRAEMGHPESFNLKYLGVGNEQWGEEYPARLQPFIEAIRKKYPEIQIVGSAGPVAGGDGFNFLWKEMKRLKADLVDEHYYMAPEWFYANAERYDNYDRKGPKVFAGEYAAHAKNRANSLNSALAEASFMTGLERNADVVRLATYAPLFAHYDAWQWAPDMIWFDNLEVVKTPNYFVQQLYATHAGTDVLSVLSADKKNLTGQDGIYASAVKDRDNDDIILKIVNSKSEKQQVELLLKGVKSIADTGKWIVLTGHPDDCNTLEKPLTVSPHETTFTTGGKNTVSLAIEPYSFNVIRLHKEK